MIYGTCIFGLRLIPKPSLCEHLSALSAILEGEGYAVTVGVLETHEEGPVNVGGTIPDLILLNNDLTDGPLPDLGVLTVPSPKMGWYQRRKSSHFKAIQPLVDEISQLLDIDPWLLSTQWFVSEGKCLDKDTCRHYWQQKRTNSSRFTIEVRSIWNFRYAHSICEK